MKVNFTSYNLKCRFVAVFLYPNKTAADKIIIIKKKKKKKKKK